MTAPTSRIKRIAASATFCVLTFALLTYAGDVLKPPRTGASDGAVWAAFKTLPEDSIDVLVLGNSHAFTGVDTAVLWRAEGIPAFVNAGPTQKLEVTKYYLRESLRTQSPQVVALEMSSLSYARDRFNRSFHDININYMPWSAEKIAAGIMTSPPEERVGALLDLWTYHGRWSEITWPDFALSEKDRGGEYLHGYKPRTKSEPVTATPYAVDASAISEIDERVDYNLEALREIATICEDRDIELLLFLTPTGPPGDYSYQLERAGNALTTEFGNVRVLDLSGPGAVPGLSYASDFYDGGHLIYPGAQKATSVLAEYLAETYGLTDRREDPAYSRWSADAALQDAYTQRHKNAPGAK